jgi:hypothetical protein
VNLDIQNCSGLGIRVRGGKHHLLHSCRIENMGRGGIDFWAGDWKQLIPCNSIIENCSISRLSRIDRTYTPALLLEGMGIKVRHNSFTRIPSSAIRLEASDTLIEMNYFSDCVYESGDQGTIDMWANPLYRGNICRWNDFDRIYNLTGCSRGAAAVRHDDFISGFMTYANIMRKGGRKGKSRLIFGAVQLNGGTDSYVEGNIIVDWANAFTECNMNPKYWSRIRSHVNSKRMLETTPWQSEAWQKKYPMVKDLANAADNRNSITDNRIYGPGNMGTASPKNFFANQKQEASVKCDSLQDLKPLILPWHPIPLDLIGPYKAN